MKRTTALSLLLVIALLSACTKPAPPDAPAKTTLRINRSLIDVVLPEGVTMDDPSPEGIEYVSGYFAVLRKDDREIGYIRLRSTADVLAEEMAYFLEDPVKNHRALYQGAMPMGSLVYAGQDYTPVYTSDDALEGTATDRMMYCGDGLDDEGNLMDYSHYELVAPPEPPDTRSTWARPLVWGYNLNRGHFVMIELDYDAMSAQELQRIAETLRIV